MPTFRAKLVGQGFNQGAKSMQPHLKPGRQVLLVREPDNPYGSEAVEVYVRLGHVNKESAAVLADLFDNGHPALRPKGIWTIHADLGNLDADSIEVHIPEPRLSPTERKASNPDDDEIPF